MLHRKIKQKGGVVGWDTAISRVIGESLADQGNLNGSHRNEKVRHVTIGRVFQTEGTAIVAQDTPEARMVRTK